MARQPLTTDAVSVTWGLPRPGPHVPHTRGTGSSGEPHGARTHVRTWSAVCSQEALPGEHQRVKRGAAEERRRHSGSCGNRTCFRGSISGAIGGEAAASSRTRSSDPPEGLAGAAGHKGDMGLPETLQGCSHAGFSRPHSWSPFSWRQRAAVCRTRLMAKVCGSHRSQMTSLAVPLFLRCSAWALE